MSNKFIASFSELKPNEFAKESPQPTNLDLDLEDIDLPIKNEEEQKKLQDGSKKIREWIENHLNKIDDFRASSKEALADPWVRQEAYGLVQKIWTKINDLLHKHPEPAYRQAAFVSLLVRLFKSANPENFVVANEQLDHMVKDRYLIEVTDDSGCERAPLYAWKRRFRIPEHACFGRPEFGEVQKELEAFVNRTMRQIANRRNDRVKELQDEATLDAGKTFEKGSEGTSFLYIPPQISKKEDGKIIMNRGGFMLVEVKEGQIYPIEGVGSFENRLQEAYASEVYIKSYTLDWEFPPGRNKLQEAGLSDRQRAGFYLFWGLLKRAKDRLQANDRYKETMLALSKEVSISEDAFFLERQEGVVFVNFEGIWENWIQIEDGKKRKETIRDLFFLAERQGKKIRIVACPEHLKSFFADCMGSYNEGEKFFGVPQPLQAVLQAQYGACQTKALIV